MSSYLGVNVIIEDDDDDERDTKNNSNKRKEEENRIPFFESAKKKNKIQSTLPPMTEEQKKIVASDGEVLAIQAYAGSGKTTTLQQYCRARPDVRFLYIAFNKGSKEIAESRFDINVETRTIDSLCYEISRSRNKLIENLTVNTIKSLLPHLQDDSSKSWKVFEYFKGFLGCPDYGDVEVYEEQVMESNSKEEVVAEVIKLWTIINQPDFTWTSHEVNRKLALFRNGGKDATVYLNRYDTILVDECQDMNAIMLAIILQYKGKKVFVGDTHQAIYRFLGNVNCFDMVPFTDHYTLTRSFRFSKDIASRANWIITQLKSIRPRYKVPNSNQLLMGTLDPNIKSIMGTIDEMKENFTYLSRVNKTLFIKATHFVIDNNRKVFWNGKDEFINRMENTMKTFHNKPAWRMKKKRAEEDNDFELLSMMELIEMYSEEDQNISYLKNLIQQLTTKLCREESQAEIILSTVHKAKGLEFNKVIIDKDIFSFLKKSLPRHSEILKLKKDLLEERWKEFIDETNVYYVAVTRCKTKLDDRSFFEVKYILQTFLIEREEDESEEEDEDEEDE